MKKIIGLSLLLPYILLGMIPAQAHAQAAVKERVIVMFKDKVDRKLIHAAGGSVHRELQNVPAVSIQVPIQALKGLSNNPNVQSIEKDVPVKVKGQTADWGIASVKAAGSWSAGYTGKGVKVAVIDTGIATNHSDLSIAGGASFVSYTSSYHDDNGHGTHVAGIIGARNNDIGVVGAAPDAQLYAVKVLDANGSGYLSDVAAGIDWSITNQVHIVNLSVGSTSDSYTLHQVVDKAYNNGISVVAAAGNSGLADGSGDTVEYPAKYSSAVAVAAVDSANQRASFSSTGSKVEVAAPGVNIYSTYLNNGYAAMSGTSMATPYAAGVLALLKEQYPAWTNVQLREKLTASVIDLGAAGKDTLTGYGLIQAPQTAQTQPAPSTQTITSVVTDKSTYLRGETVTITATVKGANGAPIAGVTVAATITTPGGTKLRGTGTTNSSGAAVFKVSTTRKSATGTYQVAVQSSAAGLTGSSATAQYVLK